MSIVRICSSTGLPLGPITVVCSDWYMLNLGIAMKSLNRPGHRVPPRVDHAEHRVAVADRVDEDPDADQVVDVGEVAAAHDHLLVDGVVVLRSTGDRRLDLRVAQVALDGRR